MNPVQYILILLVRLYRCTLSPAKVFLFGPLGNCRFEPSCSQYALDALQTHGALSGSWLAVKRVCRCHPYGGCGHDPAPAKSKAESGKRKAESKALKSCAHLDNAALSSIGAASFPSK